MTTYTFTFEDVTVKFHPSTTTVKQGQEAAYVLLNGFREDGSIATDCGTIKTSPEFTKMLNANHMAYVEKSLTVKTYSFLDGYILHVSDVAGKCVFSIAYNTEDILFFHKLLKLDLSEEAQQISLRDLDYFQESIPTK